MSASSTSLRQNLPSRQNEIQIARAEKTIGLTRTSRSNPDHNIAVGMSLLAD